ncbi:MAG: DUF333 domain-containing protein [Methanocalculus sp. MSAO_Arc1]|uniref:putative hemolysin n=1 Tax=Methanocalculus TaxID=71151 RepID=UPI000FF1C895|nr:MULTISPECIES: DUF333 domain-containing protein [unclassified Methanocalculus]MCP1662299.1 putative hemolysin [Methanocalculus sp. AMF5]RQD80939.1 MAG: DUF333 domain-containing protein [Methanocalculus sp. MSAO_Arc1]
MNKIIVTIGLVALAACLLLAAGCVNGKPPESPEVTGIGVVTYIDLEGGFYGIIADDGREFLPLNLPEDLKVDGTEIVFTGEVREDVITMYMWGTPLQLEDIQKDAAEPYISGTGVITYIDLEGGFYGIISGKGNFLPIGEEYQEFLSDHADRTVDFTVNPKDVMTIQQWGQPVEIIAISLAEEEKDAIIKDSGVVTYIDLEGGFYGIITGDDTRYLPVNLADEFSKDGLPVTFTATKEDVMTIQMWGTPVQIITMEEKDEPLVGMPNPAAVFVTELGYEYEIRSGPDGEYGVAILPDGTEIEEWELYWQHHDNT